MILRKPLATSTPFIGTHPLAKGLLGLWSFNECGGTNLNSSLSRLDGTIGSGCSWVTSPDGGALSFNGTINGSVDGGAFGNLAVWSIEAWFKRNGVQTQQAPLFTDRFNGGHMNYFLFFNSDASHSTSLYAGWFDGSLKQTTGFVIPDNTWTHAVGVNDGTNVYLYVNGVNTGTTGVSNATGTSDSVGWRMGRHADNGASPTLCFNGSISKVSLYSRPLTAAEAMSLYVDSFGMFRTQRWEMLNVTASRFPLPQRGRMTHRDRRFIADLPFQAARGL